MIFWPLRELKESNGSSRMQGQEFAGFFLASGRDGEGLLMQCTRMARFVPKVGPVPLSKGICIELMTSNRKLKASREGSKCRVTSSAARKPGTRKGS